MLLFEIWLMKLKCPNLMNRLYTIIQKILILLSLRAIYYRLFHYKTPCNTYRHCAHDCWQHMSKTHHQSKDRAVHMSVIVLFLSNVRLFFFCSMSTNKFFLGCGQSSCEQPHNSSACFFLYLFFSTQLFGQQQL